MTSEKKVVLVTGASRGIGRAVALEFARNGWRVGINYVKSDESARQVEAEVRRLGGDAVLLKADVGDSSQVKDMVSGLERRWGRIDALVNNAGVTRDRTILKMSDEEWNEVLRVNLSGSFWCLRECARVLSRQKDGAIVNVASILGVKGSIGNANYVSAKAGLIGLTKAAAKELGRFNVRVNAVLPGFHLTEMGLTVDEKQAERVRSEHALGRLTDLGELARFIVFLCEQKSASGQVYNFDSRVLG
jgi:3-oxoacyl-[acyl-carrier protein] reductase